MTILEEKYLDFDFNSEFPDLYHIILYESGGDFETYSKIIGYKNSSDFWNDYNKFENLFNNKFFNHIQ